MHLKLGSAIVAVQIAVPCRLVAHAARQAGRAVGLEGRGVRANIERAVASRGSKCARASIGHLGSTDDGGSSWHATSLKRHATVRLSTRSGSCVGLAEVAPPADSLAQQSVAFELVSRKLEDRHRCAQLAGTPRIRRRSGVVSGRGTCSIGSILHRDLGLSVTWHCSTLPCRRGERQQVAAGCEHACCGARFGMFAASILHHVLHDPAPMRLCKECRLQEHAPCATFQATPPEDWRCRWRHGHPQTHGAELVSCGASLVHRSVDRARSLLPLKRVGKRPRPPSVAPVGADPRHLPVGRRYARRDSSCGGLLLVQLLPIQSHLTITFTSPTSSCLSEPKSPITLCRGLLLHAVGRVSLAWRFRARLNPRSSGHSQRAPPPQGVRHRFHRFTPGSRQCSRSATASSGWTMSSLEQFVTQKAEQARLEAMEHSTEKCFHEFGCTCSQQRRHQQRRLRAPVPLCAVLARPRTSRTSSRSPRAVPSCGG